jgi:hypothetical protein
MTMVSRRQLLSGVPALLIAGVAAAAASAPREVIASYSDEDIVKIKRLTLPRVLVYDAHARLIDRNHWPSELVSIRKQAGEAFCCISDKPAPPGSTEPPPDCKIVVYGEDIHEHFAGLRDADGAPVVYETLPPHRYLVVDYYADWCAPCIPVRRSLQAFIASPAGEDYVALVVDFSQLPRAQKQARERKAGS